MRRLLLAVLLFSVAFPVLAQKQPVFTRAFSKEEFARRRAALAKSIGPAALAVVRGNEGMRGYVPFRQNNELFYFTGVEAPGAILLVDGKTGRSTLFLPPRDERREKFEGAVLAPDDASRALTGIDNIYPLAAFTSIIGYLQAGSQPRDTVYVPLQPQELEAMSRDLAVRYNVERLDDPWDGQPPREARFANKLRERYPGLAVRDLSPIIDRMRLIKSPEEIAVIRKSSELAALALAEAMRSSQPGQYEYELDALARFLYFRNGAQGLAYYALVANGRNAYAPHYHAGLSQLTSGDLLLMDFAPDYHYYMSDVTRMWPVNGHFTQPQRELYSFYLECYRAILAHIRPGVSPRQIGEEAVKDMDAVLAKAHFSNPNHAKAASKFIADYRARLPMPNFMLGHWVGMSTHDVGGPVDVLQPGEVFTIEPALTVPEDETYIRLEDMLLVTDKGVEVLSTQAPEDPDAIEKLMQERGILKQVPRLLPHDAVVAGKPPAAD